MKSDPNISWYCYGSGKILVSVEVQWVLYPGNFQKDGKAYPTFFKIIIFFLAI